MTEETGTAIELATELTAAWLANPNTRVSAEDVPAFLQQLHGTLVSLSSPQSAADASPAETEFTPAVSVRKSLGSKDHIISMIDGKPYKTMRRHLSRHGLTAEQYRERYGLKPDYPMVSEAYSQVRREMAKKIGLGSRKPAQAAAPAPAPMPPAAEKPARGKKRKAATPAS